MAEIIIKHGRERSLLHHHPWIFSGSIASVKGAIDPGQTVDVISSDGEFLARAAYNPYSQISARVWSWDPEEEIGQDFFIRKIKQAAELRQSHRFSQYTNALRLVHGESDGIPGLIVDEYDEVIVVQFLTSGVEYWRECITESLRLISDPKIIYERSDVDVRKLEGLENRKGVLFGDGFINPVKILENNNCFLVDVENGHKTGFYLDQRDNRLLAREISNAKNVLDCFAYTGGFAINAMNGKSKTVTLVDSSKDALELAQKNFVINNISLENVQIIEQDVFKFLRLLRDKGDSYDLIILDPPKFAPTSAQADRAARAYKDINLLALKLLNKGGMLLTFSCSGGVSEELFQKIIAGAASDAGVDAVILNRLHQSMDHPVALNFPEGAYLKGFLIEKIS